MDDACLAGELRPELSQGDILDGLIFLRATRPPQHLGPKVTLRGGIRAWAETDNPLEHEGFIHMLAVSTATRGLIVSHDCAIDKGKRVLIAPVRPIASQTPEVAEVIRRQEDFGLMPLGEVPGAGECYADLRMLTFIDKRLIPPARVASLSDVGRDRLQVQLLRFLVNRELPSPPA